MKIHEIERRQTQPEKLEIILHLDPALFWFQGHFAVQPLLPGVAQLDWVIRRVTAAEAVRRNAAGDRADETDLHFIFGGSAAGEAGKGQRGQRNGKFCFCEHFPLLQPCNLLSLTEETAERQHSRAERFNSH